MFFSIPKAVSLLFAVTGVFASPVARGKTDLSTVSSISNISFNTWGGLASLAGFDDFFGIDNFDGFKNQQIIVLEQVQICKAQEVRLIQQQLAIIQEFAKQVIAEQICDVETQVLVLEQFRGGLRNFKKDLRRQSGRDVGFDASIALLILQLFNQDGSLNIKDFGFKGIDIGKKFASPSGSNWKDDSSPKSIDEILKTLEAAKNGTVASS